MSVSNLLCALLVSLACVVPTAAEPAEPVSLQPHWREGQTARYHFWTTRIAQTTLTAGDRSRTFENRIATEGEVLWQVQRVNPDGSATATMTLTWMTAALTGPSGQTAHNDSREGSGDTPPVQDLLDAMTGVALIVEVAADGSIADLSGVDAIRRKAENPDAVPVKLDFIESASDLATIPGAPADVRPGEQWTRTYRWTHDLGFLDYRTQYTFEGVEWIEGIPVAVVSSRAEPELDIDRSKLPEGGPPLDIELVASDHEGRVLFDLTRHEAVGRQSTDTRTIDFTLRLPSNQTVSRRLVETIHAQTLRVAEE